MVKRDKEISTVLPIVSNDSYTNGKEGVMKSGESAIYGYQNNLKERKGDFKSTQSAYSTLESKLNTMETAADAMRKTTNFNAKTATVDGEDTLTASASGSVIVGNYSITEVTALV